MKLRKRLLYISVAEDATEPRDLGDLAEEWNV
jgi:hypothetical protein